MERISRLLLLGIAAIMFSAMGLACNTTEGMGDDLESAGDEIEDATD